jgi:hypothetical protein
LSITEPDKTGAGARIGTVPKSTLTAGFCPAEAAGQIALPLRGRAEEKDDRDQDGATKMTAPRPTLTTAVRSKNARHPQNHAVPDHRSQPGSDAVLPGELSPGSSEYSE